MKLQDRLKLSFQVLTKGSEGSWRGTFFGSGENGGSYPLSRIEDGWSRNLSIKSTSTNVDAFACANHYATALSGVGMKHIKKKEDGSVEVLKNTPASRFCRYPNHYQSISDFFMTYVIRLMLTGNSVAVAHKDDRFAIDEVHLLPSSVPRYGVTQDGQFFYDIGGNPMIPMEQLPEGYLVPSRYIAHTRLYCPSNPLDGVSPLTFAMVSGGLGDLARLNAHRFFNNESRPSGVLSTDLNLDKVQMEKLRTAWFEHTSGQNIGGTPILSSGLKWTQTTMNAVDAELIQTLRLTSLDIAKVFGIPPAMLGLDHGGTMSSTEALINQWRAMGLNFVAQHIESSFERLFQLPADEELRFDLDNLARSDFATKVDALTKSIQQGLMSPNEARARIDLGSVKYGDEPRVQAQVVPLSQVEMMKSAPTVPTAPVEKPSPINEDTPKEPEVKKIDMERQEKKLELQLIEQKNHLHEKLNENNSIIKNIQDRQEDVQSMIGLSQKMIDELVIKNQELMETVDLLRNEHIDLKARSEELELQKKILEAPLWCKENIYRENSIVTHHFGQTFKALKDTAEEPSFSEDWERLGFGGFRMRGGYEESEKYSVGDIYLKDGSSFLVTNSGDRILCMRGNSGKRGEKGDDGLGKDGLNGIDGRDGIGIALIEKSDTGIAMVLTDGNVVALDLSNVAEKISEDVFIRVIDSLGDKYVE